MDQRFAAEESLRQALKMEAIGQLTGGVAHDFNNLLTVILGNLEMAKRQLIEWTDAEHAKLGRRIENAMQGATRAASLTKRLLAFSRQQTLNPTIIDVNRLLSGLADFLQRAIGEDISLEIVGSAGVWPVEADQTELEAAILNLAINARDAMPEGGKLTIEASNSYLDEAYCRQNTDARPGQYVQITVTDTGAGMTKETIDRAFEPFFTTKAGGPGDRTRPQPGLRLRQAVRRACEDLQRSRRGDVRQNLLAPPCRVIGGATRCDARAKPEPAGRNHPRGGGR